MTMKWKENCRCWIGKPKASYPRFEAWRSDDSAEDPWCLDMFTSPNARPIKVRHLESLDAAKEFAEGLLAEFDYIPGRAVPAGAARESKERRVPQVVRIRPLPQTT